MPRTKSNIVEHSAIFPQSDFAFRAAVEIVKHRSRNSLARDRTKVGDAYDSGQSDAGRILHRWFKQEESSFPAQIVTHAPIRPATRVVWKLTYVSLNALANHYCQDTQGRSRIRRQRSNS